MRLLMARAAGQGEALAAELRALGYEVVLKSTVDFSYLGDNVSVSVNHNIVFPSSTAVHFFNQYAKQHDIGIENRVALCVGPTTASACRTVGFSTVIVPNHPPYDSDALFDLMNEQEICDNISIVTSIGGRRVIQQKLEWLGASYDEVQLYERIVNQKVDRALIHYEPEAIIVSSYDVWLGVFNALGNNVSSVRFVLAPSARVAQKIEAETGVLTHNFSEFTANDLSQTISFHSR